MHVSSTFFFRDIEVKLIGSECWFWVRYLEVIVLAGDLEHSLQCMVFDVMPIVLPVSID